MAATRALRQVPSSMLMLGPVREDERDRLLFGHGEKRFQEPEGRHVCPLHVLEDEAEWTLACECAREPAGGVERLLLNALTADLVKSLGKLALERQAEDGREEWVHLLDLAWEQGS